MAIRPFLAMTPAEMRKNSAFPKETAWMACHFSPYCTGLSNLPRTLPPGSLLILDDITPIHGHAPKEIAAQLQACMEALECRGLLLDFQRPGFEEAAALALHLSHALPCPVGVSELYAQELDCPVFLPPVPLDVAMADYLAPWRGREVWLELALDGAVLSLTEEGIDSTPLPSPVPENPGFAEDKLHCHYRIQLEEAAAKFTLWRTREDLDALVEEAGQLGVTACIGLYQELQAQKKPDIPSGANTA